METTRNVTFLDTLILNAMLFGIMWIAIASFFATETCSVRDALILDCPVSE